MNDTDAAFILHAGDMSYADCDGERWSTYFDLIEPLAKTKSWMVAAGNHEVEPNNMTGHIMDPYKHLFKMPSAREGEDSTHGYYQEPSKKGSDCCPSAFTGSYDYGNSFYSFSASGVHFFGTKLVHAHRQRFRAVCVARRRARISQSDKDAMGYRNVAFAVVQHERSAPGRVQYSSNESVDGGSDAPAWRQFSF